jgi:2-dehydropantoate 2-reductase
LKGATMRIAVMGSGGIGAYYGGLLSRAGHDVLFIARGEHLNALQSRGLQIKSVHGDFSLERVQATDSPQPGEPADLVLVCVKTPDTEQAAAAVQPLVGERTMVASLQNGVDAAVRIGAVLGREHVVGAATYISAHIEAPGIIRQVSAFRRIVLGEFNGSFTRRVEAAAQAFAATGVDAAVVADIEKVLWTKFVFIAGISGVGCLTRLPLGQWRAVPPTRKLLEALLREVTAVAHAKRVPLGGAVVEETLRLVDGAEGGIKPSMQLDVERGRRSELESMIGIIIRLGRELAVATPAAEMVYAALLPAELRYR